MTRIRTLCNFMELHTTSWKRMKPYVTLCNLDKRLLALILAAISILAPSPARAHVIDTYFESFDRSTDGVSIDGIDYWQVDQGSPSDAVTQCAVTVAGTGASLELKSAETPVNISRPKILGNLTPCWVQFYVRPGLGGQTRDVPEGKVGAITFDYTGKIYAADGLSWVDTGVSFTAGTWYRVLLRINFLRHVYAVYVSPAEVPLVKFIPIAEGLEFIDGSINSLSDLGFDGAYNSSLGDNSTYIENILVNFIRRIEIITPAQTLSRGEISQQIIVQLQNDNSAPQEAWKDIALQFKTESRSGEFSMTKEPWEPIAQVIVPEGNFQTVFYYRDEEEGEPMISLKEYPEMGWEDALQRQKIKDEVRYFNVSLTMPQVAGVPFRMTVTAKDEYGKVDKSYKGSVEMRPRYVSPASGEMKITPETVSGFVNGVLEVEASYPDCGVIEIEVRDAEEVNKTGRSGGVMFMPASFEVKCGAEQVVSKPFSLEVTARNAQGDVAPNYEGPCELTPEPVFPENVPGGAISPCVLREGNFDSGSAAKAISYNRWGRVKIRAQHSIYLSQNGLSDTVQFDPADIGVDITWPPEGREFFYTGENIEVIISLLDNDGSRIENYSGSVKIEASADLNMPPFYKFSESDRGRHVFRARCDSPGAYSITAQDTSSEISVKSRLIRIKTATIKVIDSEGPAGGAAEVIIIIVDEDGNIITSENNLPITVRLTEENPNKSALTSAILNPVVFHNGVARIIITNPEAEDVTVTPVSDYGFDIKKGTVKFGRFTRTGIGTVLWRELKK